MSWTHIQGHERWTKVFADVVRQNRLGQAYLFLGPAGVGKRLFARELAKTLLCESRGDIFAACDRCPACLLIDAGTHPDFFCLQHWEDGKTPAHVDSADDRYFWEGNFGFWLRNELPIKLMRGDEEKGEKGFCGKLNMKPARGHGRVGIIDDADELNPESANCFLKTLEEPPPHTVFILIGTSRDKQMPTVQSRCQVVRFAPLPPDTVQNVLRQQGVAEELLPRLTKLADGSPGRALALADPALWEFRRKLLAALSAARADLVALAKAWTHFAEEAGKEPAAQRRQAGLVLRLLQAFLADALAVSLGAEPRMQDEADRNLLLALCARASPEKILLLLERTMETEKQLDRYVQVSLVLEALLVSGEWG